MQSNFKTFKQKWILVTSIQYNHELVQQHFSLKQNETLSLLNVNFSMVHEIAQ